MLNMIFEVAGEYQNIIQVNKHKSIKHLSEHIINKSLEDSWSVN